MHNVRRTYNFASAFVEPCSIQVEAILAYCCLVDKPPLFFAILSCIVDREPTIEGFPQAFTSQMDAHNVLLFGDVWLPLSGFTIHAACTALRKMISDGLICVSSGAYCDPPESDVVVLHRYPLLDSGRLQLTTAGAAEWLPFERNVLFSYPYESAGVWGDRKVLIANRAFLVDCPFGRPCSQFPEPTDTCVVGKCWSQVVPRWKPAVWRDVQVGYMTVCVATHNSWRADYRMICELSSNSPEFWRELLQSQ